MTWDESLSFIVVLLGALFSFATLAFLGLLWWLARRRVPHLTMLECLFVSALAIFLRQAVALLSDQGVFGDAGSTGRLVARHSLTVALAAASGWVAWRMVNWWAAGGGTLPVRAQFDADLNRATGKEGTP